MRYFELMSETPAWHGSPHHFKTFKIEKINTGEGNQAYGWGLYFASQKQVADYYRRRLSKFTYQGKAIKSNQERLRSAIYQLVQADGDKDEAKQADTSVSDLIDQIDYAQIGFKGGGLYEVELPDDNRFLHWDVGMKQQPAFVKKAFRALIPKYGRYAQQVVQDNDPGEVAYAHLGNFNRNVAKVPFDDVRKATSLDLLQAGIVGIKYLDAESRDAENQTFNYVVFDPKLIRIVQFHK